MANILAVLPGITLSDLSAMSLSELARWHEKARARSGAKE
ncbi:MAG: Phage GpE [Novosphingobium sp.]|nr:Phage GpE [Novosphingobium sp.]